MNSTRELLRQIADPHLSKDRRVRLRCELARKLEEAGKFDAALEALDEVWSEVGKRPNIDELEPDTAARLLLRAGALTAYIGGANQIKGSQEAAKDLLSESLSIFEREQNTLGEAEVQTEIALCYWREGAFDEARVMVQEALVKLTHYEGDLKAVAMLRSAIIEWSAKRFHDALRILTDAQALFDRSANDVIKGKFHHGFGFVLRNLGEAEDRQDYIDLALIEYAAASGYFKQAGLQRYEGCVENNLGFLFGVVGQFDKAHEHLDRAQVLFTTIKDFVNLAQVDETRARVMLSENRVVEAEKTVRRAVQGYERGDQNSLLAEALITHGIALGRLNHPRKAFAELERAAHIALEAGDGESAGRAALVMLEELSSFLTSDELRDVVDRVQILIENSQDISTLRRLSRCVCRRFLFIHDHPGLPSRVDWTNFSLKRAVLEYEAHFIKMALKETRGSRKRAAEFLGLKSRQGLTSLLKGRHKDLSDYPIPTTERRRSIIPREKGGLSRGAKQSRRTVRILHVEDHEMVAGVAKEILERQGWQVETCTDGNAGLEKISGNTPYDLLLIDYDLPGINGLELVMRARKLAHRSQTPIIVLSAAPVEVEALRAGADEFLQKPQAVTSLVDSISLLLAKREHEAGGA
jgi:CheY-like chemotaxis protein